MNRGIMFLLAFTAFVLASDSRADFTSGDFNYQTNATGASITGYIGTRGSVIIPDLIKGVPVTSIDIWAFDGCSSVTNITIPAGVSSIGDMAFNWCRSLTTITIPNSVVSIGSSAFSQCSSIPSITIPSRVTSIGEYAFDGCSSLTNITILSSLTSISFGAFFGCSSLISITVPNSVTSIEDQAFRGCRSLTTITIPNSVTSIGDSAFSGCSSLTSITIPNSVTSIGDSAFSGCSSLTSITIPNSVTNIRNSAFSGCSSLPSTNGFQYVTWVKGVLITGYMGDSGDVDIPLEIEGLPVISIGDSAFSGCSSITSITIPNTVTSIGRDTFRGCRSLTNITIPNSVTSIGDIAFFGCSSLPSTNGFQYVTWGEDVLITGYTGNGGYAVIPAEINGLPVTSIGNGALSECRSLTSITIPNSVTNIGNSAFYICDSLTSITIPNSVTSIGDSAFSQCRSLTSITIPNSVTNIGGMTFFGCSSLTNITIPSSVTSIGWAEFYGCTSLTSITIPNSVTSIGGVAFAGCHSLTGITIPNTVTSIGFIAFSGCSSLPSTNGFQYVTWGKDVLITGYTGNGGYAVIPAEINGLPVTSIGNGAVGSHSLTGITIPNTVTTIGDYAFSGCRSLTSITIPNSVTSIGTHPFDGCSISLKLVALSVDVWNWLLQNASSLEVDPSQIVLMNGTTLPQSITFPPIAPVIYGLPPFQMTATATSGLPVSFTSSSTNISITGSTVTILGTGTASIMASQSGNSTYAAAPSVTNALVVNGPNPNLKTQTITFSSLKAKTWTNAPFPLTATASSKLPITYTSSDPSVATVSNNILTPIGVGTTTITAYQGGNTIYNPARPVSQPQVITKATQTIAFPKIPKHTYGDAPFRLSATSSSGLPVTYTSSATNVATVLGDVVTIVGAGSAKITATQSGNGLYYAATPANQTLTVSKANQTVTFHPTSPVTFTNGGIIPFNGTASSGLPLTYTSSKPAVITIAPGSTQGAMKGKGTTTITASQAGNANYNKASATGSITIQ